MEHSTLTLYVRTQMTSIYITCQMMYRTHVDAIFFVQRGHHTQEHTSPLCTVQSHRGMIASLNKFHSKYCIGCSINRNIALQAI